MMFGNLNQDLPITALCIVTDRLKCPQNYTPIFKSYDATTETDLWKDGFFGRKINRFICYTKDYPINETYNVIEDIKLKNEGENLIGGFIPIDKCLDNNEKSFQKKTLCIKVSQRFFTSVAVSDIIILVKSKKPPASYSYIGEINNHAICVKFSPIPNNKASNPPITSILTSPKLQPPAIPPRPLSISNPNSNGIEQSYVHVNHNDFSMTNEPVTTPNSSNDFYNTLQRNGYQNNHMNYNPLQGVPFELNPIYNLKAKQEDIMDLNKFEQKYLRSKQILNKIDYDFRLEKNFLQVFN